MQPQKPHLYPVPDQNNQPFNDGELLSSKLDRETAELTIQLAYEQAINTYDKITPPETNQPLRADVYGQGAIVAANADYALPANPQVSEKTIDKLLDNNDLRLVGNSIQALRNALQDEERKAA